MSSQVLLETDAKKKFKSVSELLRDVPVKGKGRGRRSRQGEPSSTVWVLTALTGYKEEGELGRKSLRLR